MQCMPGCHKIVLPCLCKARESRQQASTPAAACSRPNRKPSARHPGPHLHGDGARGAVRIAADPGVGVLDAEGGVRLQVEKGSEGSSLPVS